MLRRIHTGLQNRRVLLFTLALLLILFLYMLEPLNIYLADSLRDGYGWYLFVLLAAFYLYFRGPKDGWEQTLLILFTAWMIVTRIINGDVALLKEGNKVIEAGLMFSFTGLGFLLDRKQRRNVLTVLGVGAALFYTALSIPSLYAYTTGKTILYERTISEIGRIHGYRLNILGYNPNISALWYFLSSALLVHLFFRCRRRFWRVPILLALILEHFTLAATHSRNAELAYAGCAGLLAVLLGMRYLRRPGRTGKAILLLLLFLITVPLCYKSFDGAVGLMARVYSAEAAPAAESGETADAAKPAGEASETAAGTEIFEDVRPLGDDSERLLIYRTVPEIFRQDPLRLLRGCSFAERLTISNAMLPQEKGALHNSWLEIVNYLGLPGLLLIAAFTVLMLIRCAQLFFGAEFDLATKCLVFPVLGAFSYSMLETMLFFRIDVRCLIAYLVMGFVVAETRERTGAV